MWLQDNRRAFPRLAIKIYTNQLKDGSISIQTAISKNLRLSKIRTYQWHLKLHIHLVNYPSTREPVLHSPEGLPIWIWVLVHTTFNWMNCFNITIIFIFIFTIFNQFDSYDHQQKWTYYTTTFTHYQQNADSNTKKYK